MYIGLFKTNLILFNKFCHRRLDKSKLFVRWNHRYQKSLDRLLKVRYEPTTSTVLIAFFSSFLLQPLTVLMKQTRRLVHTIKQSIYIDIYGWNIPISNNLAYLCIAFSNVIFLISMDKFWKKNDESKSQNRLFED
jgi:hypothetical protein